MLYLKLKLDTEQVDKSKISCQKIIYRNYLLFSKELCSGVNLRGCGDLEVFLKVTHDLSEL